jgi:uncharacterized protein (DUF924 family)
MVPDPEELLRFWFVDACTDPAPFAARLRLWFEPDPSTDRALAARFGGVLEAARRGELGAWESAPRPHLALVLALDQLPRNLRRGTPEAFACDPQALEVACPSGWRPKSSLER